MVLLRGFLVLVVFFLLGEALRVLVGLPLNMDDTENDMCARARKFGKRLHGRFHVEVEMVDERLTSFEAKGDVMASGGSRDFGRDGVDDRAAVLILETWFHQQESRSS